MKNTNSFSNILEKINQYSILTTVTKLTIIVITYFFSLFMYIGFTFLSECFNFYNLIEFIFSLTIIWAAFALNTSLIEVIDDYLPIKSLKHIPFQFLEIFLLSCVFGNLIQIMLI